MPPNLDSIPFDLIFEIASYVSLEDVVHLGRTSKQLGLVLIEETLCRRTVEACALHTKEAKLAQTGRTSYRDALLRIYTRRKAFASGTPYAAGVVAHATSFIYREGVLCCMTEDSITVLKLYETDCHASRRVMEFESIRSILAAALPDLPLEWVKFSLMNYCAGILALLCEPRKGFASPSWIMPLDIEKSNPPDQTMPLIGPLESTSKIFVRHTASHLFYGMHCGTGSHGYEEWKIRGVTMDRRDPDQPLIGDFVQLENFAGSDLGSTVAFEIHDGYFYALSNQTSFEVEEVDWTSLYHCIRFPLDNMDRQAMNVNSRIYRRQHAEGPINDSWTDLSLQADERTNELMIVEARREWRNGGSEQHRTFYTTSIEFEKASGSSSAASSPSSSPMLNPSPSVPLYPDDPLVGTIDSRNNPNYAPWQERLPRHVHPEYGRIVHPEYGLINDSAPSFILSKTKLRAYNLSCNAFVDLVEDSSCCPSNTRSCLRLRVGSRRVAPLQPLQPLDGHGAQGKQAVQNVSELPHSSAADPEDRFIHSPITMWPSGLSSAAETERPHRILNAHHYSGQTSTGTIEVHGVVDERSLVYMARPAGSKHKRELAPIVFVSFDPTSVESFARQQRDSCVAETSSEAGNAASDPLVWPRDYGLNI